MIFEHLKPTGKIAKIYTKPQYRTKALGALAHLAFGWFGAR